MKINLNSKFSIGESVIFEENKYIITAIVSKVYSSINKVQEFHWYDLCLEQANKNVNIYKLVTESNLIKQNSQMRLNMFPLKCFPGDDPRILITQEFIDKNNLSLNKSQDEILNYIKQKQKETLFIKEVLIKYLTFDNAKEFYEENFINEVLTNKKLFPDPITSTLETAQDFLDYMVFGWMKAFDKRGISATRTIEKLSSWLWLMGRDDLSTLINCENLYNPYGMPALIAVCEQMNIEVPKKYYDFTINKC